MEENLFLFRRFRLLDQAGKQRVDQQFTAVDLTAMQSYVLRYLHEHRGEVVYPKDLEQRFHLTHPTVSGLLARLRSRAGRFFPCWMVLNNMEHLTKRFESMLDAAMHQDAPPAAFRAELAVPYENLLVYFLFRYFLKAVNDGQLLPRVECCVFHVLALRYLCGLEDAADAAALQPVVSLYCKEVEHSEDNLLLLQRAFARETLPLRWLFTVLRP